MKTVILILFIYSVSFLFGQNLGDLELTFISLQNRGINLNSACDSLKTSLEKKAMEIDAEKNKKNINEKKIKKIMASALVLSQKIKEKEQLIQQINADIIDITTRIDSVYSARIDSLETLLNSSVSESGKTKIKSDLYLISSKRFLLLPTVYAISFDSKKIAEIDLKSINDSLEYIIYEEYLQNARLEITAYLMEIRKVKSDLNQAASLHKETEEFLEDIQDESNWDFYQSGGTSESDAVFGGYNDRSVSSNFTFTSNFYHRFVGFNKLLNHLNEGGHHLISEINPLVSDTLISGITIDEYLNLIERIENKLETVEKLIDVKLKK